MNPQKELFSFDLFGIDWVFPKKGKWENERLMKGSGEACFFIDSMNSFTSRYFISPYLLL